MKNRTDIKNKRSLVLVFAITFVIMFIVINLEVVDIGRLINNSAFQYNIISMAAVIAGFLFTGLGILISALSNERIDRLWENNYLDKLYITAFIGMILNVFTIVLALGLLLLDLKDEVQIFLLKIEVVFVGAGIVAFVWCIKELIFIITRMKKKI